MCSSDLARMIGETIVEGLRTGVNVDSLLETQGVNWNEFTGVERDDPRINPEILGEVFSLPRPAGEPVVHGFALLSGEYTVVQLQGVTNGTPEDLEESEAVNLQNFISQQSAAIEFTGFKINMENRAEISGRAELVDELE